MMALTLKKYLPFSFLGLILVYQPLKKKSLKSQNDSRRFTCPTCGYHTTIKQNFKRHLRTHTDEKPFQCTICGNHFRLKHHLKNHMLVHQH